MTDKSLDMDTIKEMYRNDGGTNILGEKKKKPLLVKGFNALFSKKSNTDDDVSLEEIRKERKYNNIEKEETEEIKETGVEDHEEYTTSGDYVPRYKVVKK